MAVAVSATVGVGGFLGAAAAVGWLGLATYAAGAIGHDKATQGIGGQMMLAGGGAFLAGGGLGLIGDGTPSALAGSGLDAANGADVASSSLGAADPLASNLTTNGLTTSGVDGATTGSTSLNGTGGIVDNITGAPQTNSLGINTTDPMGSLSGTNGVTSTNLGTADTISGAPNAGNSGIINASYTPSAGSPGVGNGLSSSQMNTLTNSSDFVKMSPDQQSYMLNNITPESYAKLGLDSGTTLPMNWKQYMAIQAGSGLINGYMQQQNLNKQLDQQREQSAADRAARYGGANSFGAAPKPVSYAKKVG